MARIVPTLKGASTQLHKQVSPQKTPAINAAKRLRFFMSTLKQNQNNTTAGKQRPQSYETQRPDDKIRTLLTRLRGFPVSFFTVIVLRNSSRKIQCQTLCNKGLGASKRVTITV